MFRSFINRGILGNILNWFGYRSDSGSNLEAGSTDSKVYTMRRRPLKSSRVHPKVTGNQPDISGMWMDAETNITKHDQEKVPTRQVNNDRTDREAFMKEIQRRDVQMQSMSQQLQHVKKEKEELLLRLSSMAGARLMDNNPDITDLSDKNRPTKLAEQYAQLYDNEWTDAYTVLENNCKKSEEETIFILRDFFIETYTICSGMANGTLGKLEDVVSDFEGSEEASKEVMKILKDNRKRNYKKNLKKKEKLYCKTLVPKEDMNEYNLTKEEIDDLKNFERKCYELCWLMTIQDPPVYIDIEVEKQHSKFDKSLYKEYTSSGNEILFVVWPTLYLHEGGPVLATGTAQCRNSKRTNQQTRSTTPSENKRPRYVENDNGNRKPNNAKETDGMTITPAESMDTELASSNQRSEQYVENRSATFKVKQSSRSIHGPGNLNRRRKGR